MGCGVVVERAADGAHAVRGDEAHPANLGRLCSKGAALAETLALDDRLLAPRVAGCDTDWDSALNLVAARFAETVREHGRESVALYVSGQLLTEDYYVANKLVKGWLGNGHIDTNSRLCMSSSVSGHKRAFGTDTVPGNYEDLELADLVVLVGSNLAWCHPVLFQRLQAAREARPGMRVVLVDPRRTATAELADVHLALAPDSDLALFGGLLHALEAAGAVDRDFAAAHLDGLDEALASVATLDGSATAAATGLDADALAAFFTLYASTDRVVTVYSQGVNQSERGTDTVNAIIDCHLATNRIGRPGCGPFSVTGQPNAMGGREVGGLANLLAAHVELDDVDGAARVQAFWDSPRIADAPGPKAVELFERVHDGRIKAVWIMATNPVDSLPDADRVREALRACPFVVVSDVVARTDTTALAHVLLPSLAWSEKDGTVTNSERRISRQRAFRQPPGQARPDWWQLADVARRLGLVRTDGTAAFDWDGPAAIFREHAALSAVAGSKDFDIGAAAALDDAAYDAMMPFQWPWHAGSAPAEHRFFADGVFHTPNARARVWPIVPDTTCAARAARAAGAAGAVGAAHGSSAGFTLNTGRIRDQWHTMTRTGRVARLGTHIAEPFAELAPADAAALSIGHADIVELASPTGSVRLRALVTDRQREGSVFAPMHWSDAYASHGRIDALVSATVDAVSGQPASKSERVSAARWPAASFGFAAMIGRPDPATSVAEAAGDDYRVLSPTSTGWQLESASRDGPDVLLERLATLCGSALARSADPTRSAADDRTDVRHVDRLRGAASRLLMDGDRLVAAVFVARGPVPVARSWIAARVGELVTHASARYRLLAGRPGGDVPDPGPTVCACLGVGARTIESAMRTAGPCASVKAIGELTGAGSNCGSCRPEIARMLAARDAGVGVGAASPVAKHARAPALADA